MGTHANHIVAHASDMGTRYIDMDAHVIFARATMAISWALMSLTRGQTIC
jgi:hypothetical protein